MLSDKPKYIRTVLGRTTINELISNNKGSSVLQGYPKITALPSEHLIQNLCDYLNPIEGQDPKELICLKNYWRIVDINGETPLVNGMIGTVSRVHTTETKLLHPKLTARFENETGEIFDKTKMNIDYQMLTQHVPRVNNDNWRDFYKVQKPLLFDYADCITVHKSQGSQADKVLVFSEVMGDREYYYRWLYTAVTRAIEKCVIVI